MKFHLRDEARETERRSPLTPDGAATLMAAGHDITVERSEKRVFSDADFAAVGCNMAKAGSWTDAPEDTTILGLKELPETPPALRHAFIHFAHLYKEQAGWQDEIARFIRGGGKLYDLEYLTRNGRRTAAFGYWAGWMGAALAAWRYLARAKRIAGPEAGVQSFTSRHDVEEILTSLKGPAARAIVIGAKGRSGTGATEALKLAGFTVTEWDIAETRNLDRAALMDHDLLVNCVLMTGPGLRLLSDDDLKNPANRITMISDVSCDPFSDFNPLPIYDHPTSWKAPFLTLGNLELTAIDNLPSLLPRESSEDFAAQLLPSLQCYPDGEEWQAAAQSFADAVQRAK